MSRAKDFLRLGLFILLGLVAGIASAGAAPAESPILLAVYASATNAPGANSTVATTLTSAGQLSDSIFAITRAATSAVAKAAKVSTTGVVTAVVELNNTAGYTVLLRDYQLPSTISAKYCFSLDVVTGTGPQKERTDFNPPLIIMLSMPDGTRPFLLSSDKKTALYFDKMGENLPTNEGFTGTVKKAGNVYTIAVRSWPAGDPCIGG